MNKIIGKHQASVSTRSFSSARHSGATVVGITYRLPDVMVYLSAQEGPMKITRGSRPQRSRKAQKRGVPNPLAPTRTQRIQEVCGKISAKERRDGNLVLNKLV